jgi:hypothetical protein
MAKNLSRDKLKMIMKYAIVPLIEQYFFGKRKEIQRIIDVYDPILNTFPPSADKLSNS